MLCTGILYNNINITYYYYYNTSKGLSSGKVDSESKTIVKKSIREIRHVKKNNAVWLKVETIKLYESDKRNYSLGG